MSLSFKMSALSLDGIKQSSIYSCRRNQEGRRGDGGEGRWT